MNWRERRAERRDRTLYADCLSFISQTPCSCHMEYDTEFGCEMKRVCWRCYLVNSLTEALA
jgi:hypothetical protein